MNDLLAQVPTDYRAQLQQLLDRAGAALASLPQWIEHIDWYIAVVLIPLGVVSLLYGYRIFKGVVTVYSSVLGAVGGWWLTSTLLGQPGWAWLGGLVGAAVMALLAWPLVRYFICFWGSVAGGLAGYAVAQVIGQGRAMLICVVIGVVLGALLAALVFRFMVILTTSVVGAHLAVFGLAALLYRVDRVGPALQGRFESSGILLPLVVAVPALFGLVYQIWRSERRESKKTAGKE
ncbi:MAG: DUF4203 domain-containing protein [Anaerolineaceae bacterium]|nr:DUF4203 domain-containing protein [Anaerolineaceae bacterium]